MKNLKPLSKTEMKKVVGGARVCVEGSCIDEKGDCVGCDSIYTYTCKCTDITSHYWGDATATTKAAAFDKCREKYGLQINSSHTLCWLNG